MKTDRNIWTIILELRQWRDPILSGSFSLFGFLLWWLVTVDDYSFLSLFSLSCFFFLMICAVYVNTLFFWMKIASPAVPRQDTSNSSVPYILVDYQISEETTAQLVRLLVSGTNDVLAKIVTLTSCRSNIDTAKALFLFASVSLLGNLITGATTALIVHLYFFFGELIWSLPVLSHRRIKLSNAYLKNEGNFRKWCEEKSQEVQTILDDKKRK